MYIIIFLYVSLSFFLGKYNSVFYDCCKSFLSFFFLQIVNQRISQRNMVATSSSIYLHNLSVLIRKKDTLSQKEKVC